MKKAAEVKKDIYKQIENNNLLVEKETPIINIENKINEFLNTEQ